MDSTQPIPVPTVFRDDLVGFVTWSHCWIFATYSYEPSYWMLLKREGFSGGLISDSSELDMLTSNLDRENLETLYRIHHKTDPDHYFTISLREEVEDLILSSRIKVFKLDKDLLYRLSNPKDTLYSSRQNTLLLASDPITAKRNELAEEFGYDISQRWLSKDQADKLHWDRGLISREAYEIYDVGAEVVDTAVDFVVSVYQIGKVVVTIVGNTIKAVGEFYYDIATGDLDGIREDLKAIGVFIGDAVDSAEKIIHLAKQGLEIFNQLQNDAETRDLVIDYFSSLYESIPYRDSRTIGIRIVAEIGIEVLLALATAGAANVARRVGQVGIKASRVGKAANRIGPFTKEAIELLGDLAKKINKKDIASEQLPPPQNPKIPAHAKNNKLDGEEKNSTVPNEDTNLLNLKTNPKDIRLAAQNWPPHKKARFDIADNFYKEAGYTNYDSHLRGIDFDQSVDIIELNKSDKIYQLSYIDEDTGTPKVGSYFYNSIDVDHTKLGFDVDGRTMVEIELEDTSNFLRSQAANIEDWNPGSKKIFQGGATQLFNPNANLGNTTIMD
ncbi:MAG: hypothetical protein ACRBCS_02640 [Cellvibrionaceae bacterium]